MKPELKKKLFRKFLNTTACFVVAASFSHDALASPDGSLVVGGSALVTQAGLETVIKQDSNRAIIRWNSFDVAQPEKVTFQQPSSNSITINRIIDSKASRIDGLISANGQIVMINPNGIVFGATSRVDVGSLVASSSDIGDDIGFMAGGPVKFTKAGNPNATIINAGTITAREAGLIGLVAPNVENNGLIHAKLGKVQLASGDIHTIDLAGDGLIQLEVSDTVLSQNIKNTGTIIADGGEVLMTAAQGRAALDAIISNHGRIQTGTIFATDGKVQKTGKITFSASTKGATPTKIIQGGEISASGGDIQMVADSITLEKTSNISVASDHGGGSIRIGGAEQGGGSLPTASNLIVENGSIIDASALIQGNGGNVVLWSDNHTDFGGVILSKGGSQSGDGGNVEVSGKGKLTYHGLTDLTANFGTTGNLLLDPTDILIDSLADLNITGSSPFTPSIDDGPSILDVATLTSALASANVTVQTRATGGQLGNITVNAPIIWGAPNTLTLDAHNNIIINQAITGQNLTLIAGNDVQVNAALTGSGILTVLPASDTQTIGVGNGSLGTLQMSITDLGNITNGWSQLVFGRTTSTVLMDLTANTWADDVVLRSDSGLIRVTGTQTMGANNLSFITNGDIDLSSALVGTGTLSVSSTSPGADIAIGTGQTGAVSLIDSELIYLTNGWGQIEFGSATMAGNINLGALTWSDNLSLQTGTGVISINGNQTMGSNNLTISADSNPVIAGNLIGSGTLTLLPGTSSTTIGVGAGAGGVFNISAAEFARIQDGWSQIRVGRNDSTVAMELGALAWTDPVRFFSDTGIITVNGAQTYGNNQAVFQTDADIALNASLSGTGQLAFLSNATGTTFGLAGEAGVINLTTAELNQILSGFSVVQFGSASLPSINPMTIGAYTWQNNILFSNTSGIISFTGAQNFGSKNLTIRTDGDVDIGAPLTGTGDITIQSQTTSTDVGVGTGQVGPLSLSDSDLGNITDGWANIILGRTDGTGALNVGAHTWNDNLTLQSGAGIITIAGTQTMGANDLTLSTGSDIAINAALTGTQNLTIRGNALATTMGVGTGQLGTVSLSNSDLGNITDGWANIILGRTDGTGALNVGAHTWNDNLTLQSGAGIITIAGAQTMGANALTISSAGDAQINAALTGTGTLNLRGSSANTIMAIGTGQTGDFQLNNADLGNITNGWSNIIMGRTDGTGALNVGAYTWNDNLTYQSATGVITIAGAQTMGANTLTISSDASPVINAALTGTGTLNLQGNSANTAMGIGTGQPGSFQLTNANIANFTNGWSNIAIGRTDGTGTITIGALTWNDNLTLQSLSGSIIIAGAQTLGANNVTFTTDGDPQINAAMDSTGVLTFQGVTDATTIGVGTGQAGSLSLSTADLNNADNTWSNIIIGRTTQTGAITAGNFTLADPLTLQSGTGIITIGAAINMGANNFTIQTDANPVIGAGVSGTQNFSILPMTGTTSIGIGTGQPGTISLDDTEQAFITNGWANIVIGLIAASGDITLGPGLTWNDNLFLRTSGVVTIAGNQNLVGNNLTIQTDSNPVINGNLAGTGTLTIAPVTTPVSIGLGDGQAGTLHLDDAELNHIVNGWGSIIFGLTNASGDINVGAYSWNDPLTLRTGTGIININGAQTMSANGLTFSTNSDLNIGATLSGTGTLLITPNGNVSMGIGTGQVGTLQLSDTELDNILDGWGSLVFGLVGSTQPVNVGAYTWNDNVTIRNGSGLMTIAGAQTMGANNLTLSTYSNLNIGAPLSGSGILTITPGGNISMGIGTGQVGTLQLSNAELNNITDGWASLVFGAATSTQPVNVGAYTWNDNVTIMNGTGLMTVAGAQTLGTNNLTLQTDSNLALNNILAGSGLLTIRGAATTTTLSIGTGQVGTLNLDDAEILRIADGWTQIDFGSNLATGTLNIGAATWNDPVRFITSTGIITVNGIQTMGANDLTISTSADPTFNAALSGTGVLSILGSAAATGIGIGDGQVGALQLSNSDLGYLPAGWSSIIFGYSGMTGAMNIGTYNWQYDTIFRTGTGIITVNGAQNSASKNISIETNSNLAIAAPIQGNGILTIRGSANATSIGIGTGQTGTIGLTDTELNFLTDGWSEIVFGHAASTGGINVGARTWNDPLHLISNTGLMTIAGIQTMGANDLTLETDSNLAINANLNGTGNLTIKGADVGTTIGINGAAGTLALSTAEIAHLTDGWGSVTIGRHDMTGDISLAAATWLNPTSFITRANINIAGTQTSTETGGDSLVFVTEGGAFINTAGAGAINPGGGRYLIYAVDASSTTLGGLSPATTINTETYFSLPPGAVVPAGNVLIYSIGATKILYLQIDDKFKVYGDGLPTFTYTYLGGLQGTDALTDAITGYTLNAAGTGFTDNAGTTWSITGLFTTALGYTTNITNGTLTVVKAPVLVQASPDTRVYGAANPTFTINYIGLKNGETSAVIDTLATATTPATVLSNVGTYTILTAGGADNNYVFNYAPNTLTITKANLTITADNKTREYGDANPAFTLSYSGFLNGDTFSVIDTLPTASTTATNTTSPTTTAITLAGGTDNNYNLILVNGVLTITKANLSVVADNKNRVYGDANPALTYTFGSFKNGETSAVLGTLPTISTTAVPTTNVGTPAITLSGGTDINYNYVFTSGTLTIAKATLTATAQNASRDYGDANPAFTVNYTGFKNGETSAVIDTLATASTTATITSGAGSAVITPSGAIDDNYSFSYINGILTINKANLAVVADNKTREYGDANPALTYTFGSFKNGETSAVLGTLPTISTTAVPTTNVGTPAITLSGGSDANYNYVFTNGTLTITKATLTATAQNASRDYGDANPAFTVNYTGFKNGETSVVIDTLATASSTAIATDNAGTTSNITPIGAIDNNYNFIYVNGTLTINKANLAVVVDNKTREYGDVNPALTYTFGSFKNGETSAVLGTLPTISTTAVPTTNVGTPAITLSGGTDINYNYVFTNGTLTITKATLTATAQNASRDYGDANPAFTVNYAGFKNGETSAAIDTLATASTTATNTTNAGTDVITATGAIDDNYNFTYVNGTLTINKADLQITADNKTREYGDANPALTYTFGSFKNGETSAVLGTLPTISTTAVPTTNVGTPAITLSGGSDANYNYVFTNGTLTITKATLTATAQNASRDYGDANPAFTVNYTGFKNGETSAVIDTLATASTTATNTTNAGAAIITATGASDDNYNFTYVDGALTINKADLQITADNKTREYGDANPALTYTFGSFKNGETSAVLGTLPTIATTAVPTTNVGTTAITLSGGVDTNYNYVFTNGSLIITKADLQITADNQTRDYGDANPALTYTFSGFKNGENSAVLGTLPTIATLADAMTNSGSSAITLTGGADGNYNYVLHDGILTITKAALLVQVDDATRAEGDANPPFGYTILSGLKNGEPDSVLSGVVISTATDKYTPRGTYVLYGAGGTATNYYVSSYLPGVYTITPGNLPIRALPSTVDFSNTIGLREGWDKWRDLIYYEDDEYIESILFGRQIVHRNYATKM